MGDMGSRAERAQPPEMIKKQQDAMQKAIAKKKAQNINITGKKRIVSFRFFSRIFCRKLWVVNS